MNLKLLIVEDNSHDRDLLLHELRRSGFSLEYEQVDNSDKLRLALERTWDAVTCDFAMPSFTAFDALDILNSVQPETPVIIVSGELGSKQIDSLMDKGAWDLIPKTDLRRISTCMRRALEHSRIHKARYSADNAWQASQDRWRFITDNIWDSVWTTDLNFMITWANPALMRAQGYSLDELKGMTMEQHLSATSYQQASNKIAELFNPDIINNPGHDKIHAADFEFRRKDGSYYWIDAVFRLIRDESGQPSEVLFLGHDISDRLQMEQETNMSAARYRKMVEMLPQAVFEFDREGRIIYANRKLLDMIGYDLSDLNSGLLIWQLFPPVEQARIRADLDKLVDGRHTGANEYLCWNKNGESFHIFASVTALDEDDALIYRGTAMDISQRIVAEEEIRRLNDELEDRVWERTRELEIANRELETFTYMASHDLRAPLRAIAGFTRMLREDYGSELPDEGRFLLDSIERNSESMRLLIDDLLEFARISRQSMQRSFTDMERLVWETINEISEEYPERTVKWLVHDIEPAICDLPTIRQVLRNLLSNAWKFTRNKPDACIKIFSTIEGDEIVYTFEDNGVGFDMKHYSRLFKVFQRLHSSQEFEGTGLGLAIAQTVISRHGGRIWADSTPGKGSSFFFSLPIQIIH